MPCGSLRELAQAERVHSAGPVFGAVPLRCSWASWAGTCGPAPVRTQRSLLSEDRFSPGAEGTLTLAGSAVQAPCDL